MCDLSHCPCQGNGLDGGHVSLWMAKHVTSLTPAYEEMCSRSAEEYVEEGFLEEGHAEKRCTFFAMNSLPFTGCHVKPSTTFLCKSTPAAKVRQLQSQNLLRLADAPRETPCMATHSRAMPVRLHMQVIGSIYVCMHVSLNLACRESLWCCCPQNIRHL